MKHNSKKRIVADNSRDIYSSSRSAKHVKKKKGGKTAFIVILSFVIVLGITVSFGYTYIMSKLNNIERTEINSSNVAVEEKLFGDDITNIALFGLDSREVDGTGRSDAIIVLTVDKKNNKIKLTSIARDSYVYIDKSHGKDKITHAYVYKSELDNGQTIKGPELSLRVINQNFNLDITDYVSVNFFQFAKIVDEIGGVYIDVNASEMAVMNNQDTWIFDNNGTPYKPIEKPGYQKLSGAQAVAYARDRYTGTDIDRTNRQKEIIEAVFAQVKKSGIGKLNKIVDISLGNCSTSLTNNEIISLATWALTNSPTIENYTVPDEDCNPKHGSDAYINGVWYYIYDLDIAKQKIHDFIKEEGYFAPKDETVSSVASE